MSLLRHPALAALAAAVSAGCAPIVDGVFTTLSLEVSSPQIVPEGAGSIEIALRLSEAPTEPVTLAYRVRGIEAQDHCPNPDFEAAEGRIEWPAFTRDASLRVWVGDDDLAETDERFEIGFEVLGGLPADAVAPIRIAIADDDRSALVDAMDFGVVPGASGDQAPALRTALAAAAELGRAVLVIAPGDYEVSSFELPPAVTLSARGARFWRPPAAPGDLVTLRIDRAIGPSSPSSLVEGLTVDGQRDLQGEYRGHEREHAHLIAVSGDDSQPGRVRTTLEGLTLLSGTGSGVWIGPNADVTVCDLGAGELWRDAVTVVGGNTVARLRHIDATGGEGTGLWIGARNQGAGGSFTLDVEADDVQVAAGDVEIESAESSRIAIRRLIMTQPPFRLDAPGGSVRISDSVLMVGPASAEHDYVGLPHDVELTSTTIVATDARPAALSLRAETLASGTPGSGTGRLLLQDCRFELDTSATPTDPIFALDNAATESTVVVRRGSLGAGFADWFAPGCTSCVVEQ